MVFKVEVDTREEAGFDAQEWFNSFKAEGNYALGFMPLPYPLESIGTISVSNGKFYVISTNILQDVSKYIEERKNYVKKIKEYKKKKEIDFEEPPLPENIKIPKNSLENLLGKDKIIYIRNSAFTLDNKGIYEYEISQDVIMGGFMRNGLSLSFGETSPHKLLTSAGNLIRDLKKFSNILEALVNGVYQEHNVDCKNLTLYLKPPFRVEDENISQDKKSKMETTTYQVQGYL